MSRTWAEALALINEYAMHVTDAANHEAASRSDLAQTAALKALAKLRELWHQPVTSPAALSPEALSRPLGHAALAEAERVAAAIMAEAGPMDIEARGYVSRILGRLVHEVRRHAEVPQPADAVSQAILRYYSALDRREHGHVAMAAAFSAIEQALGMRWVQGASLQPQPPTITTGFVQVDKPEQQLSWGVDEPGATTKGPAA